MNGREFYSVAVKPPPDGVVVLVIWDGRPAFEAARVRHPRTGRRCWLTHDKGRPVLLPTDAPAPDPRRPWAGWHTLSGTDPDYWRPLNIETWRLPLPAPAYIQTPDAPGRMWSATMRFAAVEEAEAHELAAEMERDRDLARSGSTSASGAAVEPPERQWWLDPHAVTYSEPGAISMRESEGRLMRAIAAEWWVRVEWPRLKTFSAVLAGLARSLPLPPGEAAAQDPIIARAEPTGRDQDDMLVALGWLRCLRDVSRNPPARRSPAAVRTGRAARGARAAQAVLRLRASTPPLTWSRIGEDLGRSGEAARSLYRQALAEVTAAANGRATPEVDEVRAERKAERERLDRLRGRKRRVDSGTTGAIDHGS